jgi:hypothetical protein
MALFKPIIRKVLNLAGYKLTRSNRISHFLEENHDIVLCGYKATDDFLIRVPMEKFRWGLLGFSYTRESMHPFVQTLMNYESGLCKTYRNSLLEDYYNSFQPASVPDALGLTNTGPGVSKLEDLPVIACPGPWIAKDINYFIENTKRKIGKENSLHGVRISYYHGGGGFGPISEQKGELEYNRLIKVYCSIKATGYKRHDGIDGDIGGIILKKNNSYRIFVNSGHHRIAALAALNYGYIPVRINTGVGLAGIVNREDASSWPMVSSGLFRKSEALALFDRIFDGSPPKAAGIWADKQLKMSLSGYSDSNGSN